MSSTPTPEDAARAALADALKFLGHDAREGHSSTLALLELQRIKPDPMTLPQLIERVEQNARRSLAAIDDFMDLARARTQELRPEELDLLDLLVEVAADGWAIASRQGVRVQIAPGPEVIMGWGDRELLSGALAKLLRDVVARAARGMDVACALREDDAAGAQGWVFVIADPVPVPVPATSADTETAPPRELRRTRSTAPGLALAQAVAERHGGTVRVEIGADRRQAFFVRLPAPKASKT